MYLYCQTTVRGRRAFTRCPTEVHLPIPLNVRPVAVPASGKFLTCGSDEEKKKKKFLRVIHHRQNPTELDVSVSFPFNIALIMM